MITLCDNFKNNTGHYIDYRLDILSHDMYLYTLDTCKMSIYGIIECTLITIAVTVKTIGQVW